MKKNILIIGAGASGLMAGFRLADQYKITILEAQSRMGGRICSESTQTGIIEAGAEFVHGTPPLTLSLLKKAGIEYIPAAGNMYRKQNDHLKPVEEMVEGWNELIREMGRVDEDVSMQDFLDQYYAGTEYEALRNHVENYAAGFDLADIKYASVKSLYKEWSEVEDENYRISGGYIQLISYLAKQITCTGGEIITGVVVKEVHWQPDQVIVTTDTGQLFIACKLLVTVPVSVLQQPYSVPSIEFTPPLHFDHDTVHQIGFGAVIKVLLKFRQALWPPDTGFIFSDELFPTWWTQLPDKTPLLTGWMGGPAALLISQETDEVILEKALASLANIVDKPISFLTEQLANSYVFNWQQNHFSMGGYSYSTPGTEDARKKITVPLSATLFFAGEALYSGEHPGTVEAALCSGNHVAEQILNT